MRKFIVAAALMAISSLAWGQDYHVDMHGPNLFNVLDGGRIIAAIGLDDQIILKAGIDARHAAEALFKSQSKQALEDICRHDFTWSFAVEWHHPPLGSVFVGIRPSGEIVYEGMSPTEQSKEFYETLRDLLKCGAVS